MTDVFNMLKRPLQIVDPSDVRRFTRDHYQQYLEEFQIGRPRENRVIFSGLRSIHDPIGDEFKHPGLYAHFEKIVSNNKTLYNLLNVGSTNSTAYNVGKSNKQFGLKDRLQKAKGTALGTKKTKPYPAILKAIKDCVNPRSIVYMWARCHEARFVLDQEVLLHRKFKPLYNNGITKTL